MIKQLPTSLFLLATLAGGSTAYAHARPVATAPTDGAVVSGSPAEVTVTFDEAPEVALSGIDITSGDGLPVAANSGEAGDPATLVVHPVRPLAPGAYIVHWHAVGDDGHKTEGEFSFTVK